MISAKSKMKRKNKLEIPEVRQQVFKYEPLVPLVLSIHGTLNLLFLGGRPWHWLALSMVLLFGVIGWRYPRSFFTVRIALFILVSWLLLLTTGGTGSFFLLWYFVIIAFYPLILSRPANIRVAIIVSLSYVLLLPFSGTQIPIFVVFVRAFLLLFIGWLVSTLGNYLVDYASARQLSEQNLNRVFRVSPSIIIIGRFEDGRYLEVNDRFLELTGYERYEVIGQTAAEIDIWPKPEDRQRFLAKLEKAGHVHNFETFYRRKSGDMGRIILNSELIELNGEQCIVTFAQDVTERWHAEEQILYQASLLDNVSEAIISTDENFIIKSWNKAAETLYGWQEEEVLGQRMSDIVPTEYLDTTPTEVESYFRDNGYWWGEVIQKGKDGTKHYILAAVSLIKDRNNQPTGAVAVNRDVSEQRGLQEALQQREAQYRAVVEGQTELISRHLPDGTITFVNEAYCRYFGRTREALLGHNLDTFLSPPLADLVHQKFTQLTIDNSVATDEHQEQKADGRFHWLQWTDQGLFDENGRLVEIQSVGRDITALKEAQTQLQHVIDTVPEGVLLIDTDGFVRLANPVAEQYLAVLVSEGEDGRLRQLGNQSLSDLLLAPPRGLWHEITVDEQYFEAMARPVESEPTNTQWVLVLRNVTQERHIQQRVQEQERLAAIGQMAAGIAHDFNNILAIISLYAQMISRTIELPMAILERVEIIDQQAQRAADLVQQILDFSRQSVLKRKPLDMVRFLKELISLLSRTLPETIEIEFNHSPGEYLIFADSARMQQVIVNLAVNARDAMPEGGNLNIELSQLQINGNEPPPITDLQPGSWIVIQVTDDGIGIAAEVRSRIFEPFFTTKEIGKGTGLGLAQVYGIVQQHEGFLDVKTDVDQGTTFLLYFPAFVAGDVSPLPSNSKVQLGQGQTVLVVEDNLIARQALLDALQFLNYDVIEVNNGRQALAILAQGTQEIELILSDVVMPEMGGVALFEALQEQNSTIPLVLLTGHSVGQEMDQLQVQGLAGWLAKPPSIEELSQLLAEVLKK
jgi:PAS domain S-box-containing protein